MTTYTVTLERDLPASFLSDIMITAFDGSYGGCWYWAQPAGDDWLRTNNKEDVLEQQWLSAAIIDKESADAEDDVFIVQLSTLRDGIQTLLADEPIRSDLMQHLHTAITELDAGEIDAELADCIVQTGLWGKVVYG